MSTKDVPGSNPANNDELAMGCWAESDDGSLILVEAVEGNQVVFSIFDVSKDPVVEYRDAMPKDGFETEFSKNDWTHHDKTPFPWDKVMENFNSGSRFASAEGLLNAAEKVAQHRGLKGGVLSAREELSSLMNKIQTAINNLPLGR